MTAGAMSNAFNAGSLASTYLEQEIRASDSLALVARAYELASLHVARARAALAANDLAAKGREVNLASRAISLLQCSLNMEGGGQVAANLDRVYAYLLRRLTEAHVHNDDAAFAEVGGHLAELGGTWRTVASRTDAPAAAR